MDKSVLLDRYALRDDNGNIIETEPSQVFERVARALARDDEEYREFVSVLGYFVPAGRILAGAGLEKGRATLANCFVIPIADSRASIFQTLGNAMEILSKGGGVGYNFSSLRPKGSHLITSRGLASGPCSFISMYHAAASTISQGGSRRAAQMGILNIDHPDVREFINFKYKANKDNPNAFTHQWSTFNVSVGVTEAFLKAYKSYSMMPLTWNGQVYGEISARALLRECAELAWATGDPGIINLYEHNRMSNTQYFEEIIATNPCGEVPLPPYGVCFLGSMNLPMFVEQDGDKVYFDYLKFKCCINSAVKLLDRVIDYTYYPIPETEQRAKMSRRIGLGVLGLADTLIMLKMRYGEEDAIEWTANLWRIMMIAAYEASVELAKKYGPFPCFDRDAYLEMPFVKERLPKHLREKIAACGIRNAVLLSQAPTGTISLVMGVSSGIEPNFDIAYLRTDGTGQRVIKHPLYESHKDYFVTAKDCSVLGHLRMQEAVQYYCDQAVSKTINLPNHATVEDVLMAYDFALTHGFKGITVFRDGCFDEVVLKSAICENCNAPMRMEEGCLICPNCGGGRCEL